MPLNLPLQPGRDRFRQLAASQRIVPVWTELVSDVDTPVGAYQRLATEKPSFLLESAENNERLGRYSFVGVGAKAVIRGRRNAATILRGGVEETLDGNPFEALRGVLKEYQTPAPEGFPRFFGGAVGYLAYDAVRWFEPTVPPPPADVLGIPDMEFLITDVVVIFDHLKRRIRIVANADSREADAYDRAARRIEQIARRMAAPLPVAPIYPGSPSKSPEISSNTTRERYHAMVEQAREYIRAGDIFQCVPSQRFETPFAADPVDLYRALRYVNPSPYMFCLDFGGGYSLVGSSPEVHVRLTGELVEIRPIAGTRRRGATPEEDDANERDLLADFKERAEHLMLVDLARNDVGRIARYGSVRVSDFMTVERYSHVMHIVTHVSGQLADGLDAFDVMRATFPAGTVSGSPKVRAMQIINELEANKRCTYAGAVGYFGWDGNLDSCIALRTVLLKDGKAYVQAGGGVVADSDPDAEYQETVNKAMAVMRAIELANSAKQTAK